LVLLSRGVDLESAAHRLAVSVENLGKDSQEASVHAIRMPHYEIAVTHTCHSRRLLEGQPGRTHEDRSASLTEARAGKTGIDSRGAILRAQIRPCIQTLSKRLCTRRAGPLDL
jgi:hypothetical protein